MCSELCPYLVEEYPNNWANAAAAITHPEILHHSVGYNTFEKAIGVHFAFGGQL